MKIMFLSKKKFKKYWIGKMHLKSDVPLPGKKIKSRNKNRDSITGEQLYFESLLHTYKKIIPFRRWEKKKDINV